MRFSATATINCYLIFSTRCRRTIATAACMAKPYMVHTRILICVYALSEATKLEKFINTDLLISVNGILKEKLRTD